MIRKRYVCMEQDSYNIGIIGAGPAGCCCAYFLKKFNPEISISIIDPRKPLVSLLPTGNGRCNLAYSEFDFKELAKNYPRGEKFLYSVLSKFSTEDTITLFEELGIPVYTQSDRRIFPVSNSSEDVRTHFLSKLSKVKFIKEKALKIEKKEKFRVITDMNSYNFDKLVCSIGTHYGFDLIKKLNISLVDFRPALVGLVTTENFSHLSGVAVKNVYNYQIKEKGDILFTHFGISAPLTYKISSIKARDDFPYKLSFDFYPHEFNLQHLMDKNSHKSIKNLIAEFLPRKFAKHILYKSGINIDAKCYTIDGKQRDIILENIHNYSVEIKTTYKDGETVNSGGVDLNKINSKTMESKEIPNLYFCGEIINIDGLCGGFNLQNCWSTAYVASSAIAKLE